MSSRTERIAKNTLMLYFRHILTMLVSLYTVRIKLEILGVEDFGIYNVVGGVVAIFVFLNDALANSTQRFISFSLGQNNITQARNTYSIFIVFHLAIALLLVILAQTIGLWFFNTWLNIPQERHTAAFIVYQISIFTTAVSILKVPYYATIIAYEKMSFFAMLSIFESLFKLLTVFLLTMILFDKLIVYAFIVLAIEIIVLLIHKIYCNKNFEIAHFRFFREKKLIKKIIEFSGWSVFDSFAGACRSHGINVLINIFFNVSVNAAMGIATQVRSAVYTFVTSFQHAFRPQIIKSYAAADYNFFYRLLFQTSKASFYLLYIFVLPLYINADFVLQLWLKNVPEYAVVFTRIILLASLFEALSNPLRVAINATGNIKNITLVSSIIAFANLPLSLLLLWLGFEPAWVLIVKAGLIFLSFSWLVFYSSKAIKLPILQFFSKTILPISLIVLISGALTIIFNNFYSGWLKLIITVFTAVTSTVSLVYCIGLNANEKIMLRSWIKTRVQRKKEL